MAGAQLSHGELCKHAIHATNGTQVAAPQPPLKEPAPQQLAVRKKRKRKHYAVRQFYEEQLEVDLSYPIGLLSDFHMAYAMDSLCRQSGPCEVMSLCEVSDAA